MRSGGSVFLLIGVLLIAGAGRLAYLERTEGSLLRKKARTQQTARQILRAQRGDILDSRGRVLAGTVRRPSVFADPYLITHFDREARIVAEVLGLDAYELAHELWDNRDRRFLWVQREISDHTAAVFSAVKKRAKLRAFGLQDEAKREYPYGTLAAQVLGFVNVDQEGLAGVEQSFDQQLRGADGSRSAMVDARRRRVKTLPDSFQLPRDGASVVLTIDVHLQQQAEAHLRAAVAEHDAVWGTAIAIETRTGEILALAVAPDFDPGRPIEPDAQGAALAAANERLRNRAISDFYEPGSIFKPFIAGPAVDAGLARLDDVFDVNGPTHSFGSRIIHDTHAYQSLMLLEVISKSSNIGMGLLANRCGNERLHEYVRRFGYGDRTGVRLPGESPGMVQDFRRWTRYSTQSIPIGQEIGATPLQLLTAFTVFCNDGILLRPRIVRGVVDTRGETIEDCSRPIAIRRVLGADAAREFRTQALVAAVNTGTGKRAQLVDYQVFGKTGTAQVADRDGGGYVPGAYVGSFVGGAPADDPRVAVLVSMFHPRGRAYYGGTVAAPTAKKIIQDVLHYMRVPPDLANQ